MNFPETPIKDSPIQTEEAVYRILDANSNRLREALRVLEEYFRFIRNSEKYAVELKLLRHSLKTIIVDIGRHRLLAARNTETDCFAGKNRPEELQREKTEDVLAANFKRAQEAARVIEEYAKLTPVPETSEKAKNIRFTLYTIERHNFSI